MKKRISIVIPCYRSAAILEGVVEEIIAQMNRVRASYEYELVLVNDCSPDDTFEVIRRLCREKKYITGVNLARNFGQHAALMAGIRQITGDILVCMDDDGQTPASAIMDLVAAVEAGSDVAYAKYEQNHHSGFRRFGSRLNDLMLRLMLDKPKDLYVSSFFAARRFVADEMLRYENAYPYLIGLVLRTTRNITNVTVEHQDRRSGQSGYTIGKLVNLWFNGFTAFSERPLRIATMAGVLCACAGFLYGIYTIIKKLVNPDVVVGFSALMTAIMFIGGMLMLMVGLVGEYVGRIYICINNAPQYVVREVIGSKRPGGAKAAADKRGGEAGASHSGNPNPGKAGGEIQAGKAEGGAKKRDEAAGGIKKDNGAKKPDGGTVADKVNRGGTGAEKTKHGGTGAEKTKHGGSEGGKTKHGGFEGGKTNRGGKKRSDGTGTGRTDRGSVDRGDAIESGKQEQ